MVGYSGSSAGRQLATISASQRRERNSSSSCLLYTSTRNALAVEFRRNAIRLLDDALLFDRALESVIGNLRKLKHS